MITQIVKQADNEIKIESAESLEDAKKNGFPKGEYSRYFLNNKPLPGYMAMIQHIINESPKNGSFIINTADLLQKRKEMFENQIKTMKNQILALKEQYKGQGISEISLKALDDYINKIDEFGVRVKQ